MGGMSDAPQPNILIILTDQLRRQALGCHGDPHGATPHIDTLARDGVTFNHACSTYPICVPFRFSFMTGQYAHTRQVPGIDWRMSPAERTMADEFNDAGYESIYIGKWHLWGGLGTSMMKRPVPRTHQGRWSKWFGFEFRNDFFDTCYFEDDDPMPIEINGYQTDGLFDRAMDYLGRREADKPFAMVLSVEAPHPPMEAPKALEDKWLARDLDLPPNFFHDGDYVPGPTGAWSKAASDEQRDDVIRNRKIYYAMVENLDQNVGKLRAFLDEQGLADNTIVMFLSDHGELGGAHRLQGKQYPYEESCGIPLIAGGGGLPRGRTIDEPTNTEDLFPTILGLCDLSPRDALPGKNLAPMIRGATDSADRHGVMLEFVRELRQNVAFYHNIYRGWRSKRYKYTVMGMMEGLKPWQFFDLETDPYEMHNRIDDPACADLIREHHGQLRQHMLDTEDYVYLAAAHGFDPINEYVCHTARG